MKNRSTLFLIFFGLFAFAACQTKGATSKSRIPSLTQIRSSLTRENVEKLGQWTQNEIATYQDFSKEHPASLAFLTASAATIPVSIAALTLANVVLGSILFMPVQFDSELTDKEKQKDLPEDISISCYNAKKKEWETGRWFRISWRNGHCIAMRIIQDAYNEIMRQKK